MATSTVNGEYLNWRRESCNSEMHIVVVEDDQIVSAVEMRNKTIRSVDDITDPLKSRGKEDNQCKPSAEDPLPSRDPLLPQCSRTSPNASPSSPAVATVESLSCPPSSGTRRKPVITDCDELPSTKTTGSRSADALDINTRRQSYGGERRTSAAFGENDEEIPARKHEKGNIKSRADPERGSRKSRSFWSVFSCAGGMRRRSKDRQNDQMPRAASSSSHHRKSEYQPHEESPSRTEICSPSSVERFDVQFKPSLHAASSPEPVATNHDDSTEQQPRKLPIRQPPTDTPAHSTLVDFEPVRNDSPAAGMGQQCVRSQLRETEEIVKRNIDERNFRRVKDTERDDLWKLNGHRLVEVVGTLLLSESTPDAGIGSDINCILMTDIDSGLSTRLVDVVYAASNGADLSEHASSVLDVVSLPCAVDVIEINHCDDSTFQRQLYPEHNRSTNKSGELPMTEYHPDGDVGLVIQNLDSPPMVRFGIHDRSMLLKVQPLINDCEISPEEDMPSAEHFPSLEMQPYRQPNIASQRSVPLEVSETPLTSTLDNESDADYDFTNINVDLFIHEDDLTSNQPASDNFDNNKSQKIQNIIVDEIPNFWRTRPTSKFPVTGSDDNVIGCQENQSRKTVTSVSAWRPGTVNLARFFDADGGLNPRRVYRGLDGTTSPSGSARTLSIWHDPSASSTVNQNSHLASLPPPASDHASRSVRARSQDSPRRANRIEQHELRESSPKSGRRKPSPARSLIGLVASPQRDGPTSAFGFRRTASQGRLRSSAISNESTPTTTPDQRTWSHSSRSIERVDRQQRYANRKLSMSSITSSVDADTRSGTPASVRRSNCSLSPVRRRSLSREWTVVTVTTEEETTVIKKPETTKPSLSVLSNQETSQASLCDLPNKTIADDVLNLETPQPSSCDLPNRSKPDDVLKPETSQPLSCDLPNKTIADDVLNLETPQPSSCDLPNRSKPDDVLKPETSQPLSCDLTNKSTADDVLILKTSQPSSCDLPNRSTSDDVLKPETSQPLSCYLTNKSTADDVLILKTSQPSSCDLPNRSTSDDVLKPETSQPLSCYLPNKSTADDFLNLETPQPSSCDLPNRSTSDDVLKTECSPPLSCILPNQSTPDDDVVLITSTANVEADRSRRINGNVVDVVENIESYELSLSPEQLLQLETVKLIRSLSLEDRRSESVASIPSEMSNMIGDDVDGGVCVTDAATAYYASSEVVTVSDRIINYRRNPLTRTKTTVETETEEDVSESETDGVGENSFDELITSLLIFADDTNIGRRSDSRTPTGEHPRSDSNDTKATDNSCLTLATEANRSESAGDKSVTKSILKSAESHIASNMASINVGRVENGRSIEQNDYAEINHTVNDQFELDILSTESDDFVDCYEDFLIEYNLPDVIDGAWSTPTFSNVQDCLEGLENTGHHQNIPSVVVTGRSRSNDGPKMCLHTAADLESENTRSATHMNIDLDLGCGLLALNMFENDQRDVLECREMWQSDNEEYFNQQTALSDKLRVKQPNQSSNDDTDETAVGSAASNISFWSRNLPDEQYVDHRRAAVSRFGDSVWDETTDGSDQRDEVLGGFTSPRTGIRAASGTVSPSSSNGETTGATNRSQTSDIDIFVEKAFVESLVSSISSIIFLLAAAFIFHILNHVVEHEFGP